MSVTPDFIGQRYKDTNTGNIWIANSTTPGDWTLEVQNHKIIALPTASFSPGSLGLSTEGSAANPSLINVTSISLTTDTLLYLDIYKAQQLVSISGTLTSITDAEPAGGFPVIITACTSLLTVSFPNLTSMPGPCKIKTNFALTSIALPALVNADSGGYGGFDIQQNTLLTTINIPLYVPQNGNYFNGSACALTASSVNLILARHVANAGYASGGINLSGGTNAAPTGQGIADKATLNGRLAGLCVTN